MSNMTQQLKEHMLQTVKLVNQWQADSVYDFILHLNSLGNKNQISLRVTLLCLYNLYFYVSKENLWDQMYLYIPGMKILQ